MRNRFLIVALALAASIAGSSLASGAPAPQEAAPEAATGAFKLRVLAVASDASTGATFDPGFTSTGVRLCRFLPGLSTPVVLGAAPPTPTPPAAPEPPNTAMPADVSQAQVLRFNALWNAVNEKYVDPLHNGLDLVAIGDAYEAKILKGYTEENFAKLMKQFIRDLGDGHSHYETADDVAKAEEEFERGTSFVGIGATILPMPDGAGSVIAVLPGSPAELAGIRPHDLLLSANGQPIRLPDGTISTRGEPGTSVTVIVKRGNGTPFSLTIIRAAITAPAPVDSCLVAGTRIGYIFLPTFFDASIATQVRAALQKMMADGPLAGLVIDNRMNGGGTDSQAKGVMGFFTQGNRGAYVSRTSSIPFNIIAEPIGNSQTVPLVVLVGEGTVSFGEIFSGALKQAGRAKIVGVTTNGNVELLNATGFADGSRVWLAQSTFQPVGLPAGLWEETGIVADVTVNGQWHEFTELDDPALARAIAVLSP